MLKELFDQNKNIIINTDIDGFLCGMLLQKYYGCKVVGFSNSRDRIWLDSTIDDINKPIYIDIYVANPNVVCIDQHIVAFDQRHHNEIISYGTKINPNLLRKRTFVGDMESDYYHKYPFGTVHFLMALMAREGVVVELPDLNMVHDIEVGDTYGNIISANAGHIILRADDALYSTLSPYRSNALDWWQWLDPKREISAINKLRNFIDECDLGKSLLYKTNIGKFFTTVGSDGKDGGFQNIVDPAGNIQERVLRFRDVICSILGMELTLPVLYTTYKGTYDVKFARPDSDMSILYSRSLYSYAFIYGPNPKYPNFSYTLNLK